MRMRIRILHSVPVPVLLYPNRVSILLSLHPFKLFTKSSTSIHRQSNWNGMEGMRSDLLCFPIFNKAVVVMDLTLIVGLNIDFGLMFFIKSIFVSRCKSTFFGTILTIEAWTRTSRSYTFKISTSIIKLSSKLEKLASSHQYANSLPSVPLQLSPVDVTRITSPSPSILPQQQVWTASLQKQRAKPAIRSSPSLFNAFLHTLLQLYTSISRTLLDSSTISPRSEVIPLLFRAIPPPFDISIT